MSFPSSLPFPTEKLGFVQLSFSELNTRCFSKQHVRILSISFWFGFTETLPCMVSGAVCLPEIWHAHCPCLCSQSAVELLIKEIDDKVVEKRQLDRTTRHEWQRACSAFTAKNVAPSRELAMPGRCAKTVQCVGREESVASMKNFY